ncbi:hypothetical protein M409DRAFT_51962 [Zasmidium cellare ATCC 36951]|uniref:Uncharacterized protein n=1 Tax=Zasmidium cellare ATCC 36951 TaxID=1080233 RepID=A0A6A6CVJ5_ZASCE|nr:uncharacterized protein M409DRAFT_51962 [Zasmidium cellare ATCC 36951]KAF2170220.1 hypothetical protein M409DRAFT_51962 [Zasmidium cellare ATCC 36951]
MDLASYTCQVISALGSTSLQFSTTIEERSSRLVPSHASDSRLSTTPLRCEPESFSALESASSGRWVGEEGLDRAFLASTISLGLSLGDIKSMVGNEILASLDAADNADVDDENASIVGTPLGIASSKHLSELTGVSHLGTSKLGWQLRSSNDYTALPEDYDEHERPRNRGRRPKRDQ